VADNALLVTFNYPADHGNLLVKKGYITIDGMSITLVDVTADTFTVTFIPHTRQTTVVQYYKPGTAVNIEFDILGKYVEKIMRGRLSCPTQ
jgi:riboflavin synthase